MNGTRPLTAVLVVAVLAGTTIPVLTLGVASSAPIATEVQTDTAVETSADGIDAASTVALHDAVPASTTALHDTSTKQLGVSYTHAKQPGTSPAGKLPGVSPARASTGTDVVYLEDHVVEQTIRSLQDVSPSGWLLLAGYSRYDTSDPLENDVRKRVHDAIERSPGTYPVALAETTGIPRSTVRYHVRILEEESLVFGEKVLGKQRYFPRESTDVELLAALEDEASRSVLAAVRRLEPASVSHLARDLNLAPSTASYHLSRLADAGLVEQEHENGVVSNRLSERTRLELRPHVGSVDSVAVADTATTSYSSSG